MSKDDLKKMRDLVKQQKSMVDLLLLFLIKIFIMTIEKSIVIVRKRE